jgi:NDP-sugar pyrophosphorylase family protein
MHPNIVILAGGISSRMKKEAAHATVIESLLRRAVESKSKTMLGVGGGSRPFIDYLLFNVSQAGYRNVVIVISDSDNSIHEYYEHEQAGRQFKQLSISYAVQPIPAGRTKPLGTADALLRALQSMPTWEGKSFTVCNSDNLYSRTALRLLLEDTHEHALIDYDRTALQFGQERIAQFAVTNKDSQGFLLDIIEKPTEEEIRGAADRRGRIGVSMNIFKFSYNSILPYLESVPMHPIRHEKELPTAVKMMIAEHPRSVFTLPLSEHVIDLTSQSDIPTVQEYLAKEFPEFLM